MANSGTDRRRSGSGRAQRNDELSPRIANLPNSSLHLALLMATAVALLIAVVVPIRAFASGQGTPDTPIAIGAGLTAALDPQAQSIASIPAEASDSSAYSAFASLERLQSLPGATLVPPSLLAAVGRIVASGVVQFPQLQAALLVQWQQPVPITIYQQGLPSIHLTFGFTVGQALVGQNITIGPYDRLSPAPETALVPGLHVYVQYASLVDLVVNGEQWTAYTHVATVGDFLDEAEVKLGPLDRVSPGLTEPIGRSTQVEVTSVDAAIEYLEEPLPFDTIYRGDASLLEGDRTLIQAGSAGLVRKAYLIHYENGIYVGRQLLGETTVQATDEIIGLGIQVVARPEPPPEGELECADTMTVWATWYTAANGGGSGITFTGTAVYKGIVAVDPSVIPLGTEMYIPGYGYGLAADTGGGVIGNWIDLGYGPDDVYDWATGWVDICILG